MRTISISLLFLFILTISLGFKTGVDPRKKAKQKADSLITLLVNKKVFNQHYVFDNKLSYIRTIDGNDVYWGNAPKLRPTDFTLIYKFKNDPTDGNTETKITLDSLYNLKSIEELMDENYLIKKFISADTIKKIINAKQLNKVTQVHFIYETIPDKKTVRPFIEIRNYSRAEKGSCEYCTNSILDCYKLDPNSGGILSQYTKTLTIQSVH